MARRRFTRWTPLGRVRFVLESGAVFEVEGRIRTEIGDDGSVADYEIETDHHLVVAPHMDQVDAITWSP